MKTWMTIGFQCASPSFFPSLMLRNPIPPLLVKLVRIICQYLWIWRGILSLWIQRGGEAGRNWKEWGEGKSSSEIRRGNHNPNTLHEKKTLFSIKEKKEREGSFCNMGRRDISASISALLPLSTEVGRTQWLHLNLNRPKSTQASLS